MYSVTVIGAGLAGSECAWQLARRGIHVRLIEMKPEKYTPAHKSEYFAELVCSNSLRGDDLTPVHIANTMISARKTDSSFFISILL